MPTEPPTQAKATTAPEAGTRPDRASSKHDQRWRRRFARAGIGLLIVSLLAVLATQIHLPAPNPAYPATAGEIREALHAMGQNPTGLDRPVVVVSGYRSPVTNAAQLADEIIELTGADPSMVRAISDPWADDIGPYAEGLIEFVETEWPSDDPALTTEVDVVAISMGGLVARVATQSPAERAAPSDAKSLNIHTLYTFASPHRGARLSKLFRIDTASRNMLPGSDYMTTLNTRFDPEGYPIVPYAVLHDRWVGATNASPPGQDPIWIRGRLFLSHHLMTYEPMLIADLARRLRNEEPLGSPSAPPAD